MQFKPQYNSLRLYKWLKKGKKMTITVLIILNS